MDHKAESIVVTCIDFRFQEAINKGSYKEHVEDLTKAAKKIRSLFPKLEVKTFYLHLDGTFEQIETTTPSEYHPRSHFA